MNEHLGHEHGEPAGATGNLRNGYSAKTVRTEVGDVRINVPRDRAGTFAPVMVPKHARHLSGFDEAVISLYAKGMTTGDIVNHLADVYGPIAPFASRPVDNVRVWRCCGSGVSDASNTPVRRPPGGRR